MFFVDLYCAVGDALPGRVSVMRAHDVTSRYKCDRPTKNRGAYAIV